MNYCESFCRTIQRMCNNGGGLLPAEYQQVEYLETTGEQCINTDYTVTVSSTLQTSIDFSMGANATFTNMFLFGCRYWDGSVFDTNYFTRCGSSTNITFANGVLGETSKTVSSLIDSFNSLVYRKGYQELNGTQIASASTTNKDNHTGKLVIFGYNRRGNSGGTIYYAPAGLRIYSAKLGTSDDPALYRNYIPCYRKSDNVTGMYDLVNKLFTPYTGTANFITGNNI